MESHNLKKIHLIATGGTIASEARSRVSTEGYKPSVIPVDELVAQIPELSDIAQMSTEQIFLKPSSAITDSDLFDLSARINELLGSDDCDGIIVTHGTDTMEETAFFLNLTVKSDKPVVVTGAMRPAHVISSDGLLNLYNAVCCAASDASRGMGVVISMNDLILSARDAVKFSTFKTDAFQAPLYGVLGTVRDGKVDYAYKPVKRHTASSEFAGMRLDPMPRVEILYMYQGCDDNLFKAAVAKGDKGIVTAGSGNGGIIREIGAAYKAENNPEAGSLPILVRSSRVTTGGVSDAFQMGTDRIIPSHDLNPHKASVLLRFALAVTEDPAEIKRIFEQY
ncbi:MAG: asparaginase [Clostridia bacterium]|nr:asparaginase [Clostridia bacterium]